MAENYNGLIALKSVSGDGAEDSDSITESWYYDASKIIGGVPSVYPYIGACWKENSDFICSTVKYSRETTFFYGTGYDGTYYNGIEVVVLDATFRKDYKAKDNVFSMKIASAGYQTYKILSSGKWGMINKPCGYEAGKYEMKIPVLQYDFSTNIVGEPNIDLYRDYVGKINSVAVNHNFNIKEKGRALFESFSLVPKYSTVYTDEEEEKTAESFDLTLTFKVLPQDWNWEWRNPVQLTNSYDGKPMTWQCEFPKRADYTSDKSLENMPIWSGATLNDGKKHGDEAYGTCGWDFRKWEVAKYDTATGTFSSTEKEEIFAYKYADLNDVFTNDPKPQPEPEEEQEEGGEEQ